MEDDTWSDVGEHEVVLQVHALGLAPPQAQGFAGLTGKEGVVQNVESIADQVEIDLVHILVVVEDFSEERKELFIVDGVRGGSKDLDH